jgi:hypothetical protein
MKSKAAAAAAHVIVGQYGSPRTVLTFTCRAAPPEELWNYVEGIEPKSAFFILRRLRSEDSR